MTTVQTPQPPIDYPRLLAGHCLGSPIRRRQFKEIIVGTAEMVAAGQPLTAQNRSMLQSFLSTLEQAMIWLGPKEDLARLITEMFSKPLVESGPCVNPYPMQSGPSTILTRRRKAAELEESRKLTEEEKGALYQVGRDIITALQLLLGGKDLSHQAREKLLDFLYNCVDLCEKAEREWQCRCFPWIVSHA